MSTNFSDHARSTFAALGFPDGPVVYMKSPQPLAGCFFFPHFGLQASLHLVQTKKARLSGELFMLK